MVVPEDFVVPPLIYVFALALGVVGVGTALYRLDPAVSGRTVLSLTPWMAFGGALHVVEIVGLAPPSIAPFLAAPAVYVSTAILVGLVWIVAIHVAPGRIDELMGIVGLGALLLSITPLAVYGWSAGTLRVGWPAGVLLVSLALAAIVWYLLAWIEPEITSVTGGSGIAVIFAHVLDGASTAVGVDVFGQGERTPLPRAILNVSAQLPTADVLGVGWLFLLVKLVIAAGVVWLFVPFVRESERQGHLLLAFIVAVGLGPGVHNVLLTMVGG